MKTWPHPYRLAVLAAVALLLFVTIAASAQKANYPWMEVPRKDAERVLTNSPWSHTQVDTDASEMFYSPTRPGTSSVAQSTNKGAISGQQSINNNRADRGAYCRAETFRRDPLGLACGRTNNRLPAQRRRSAVDSTSLAHLGLSAAGFEQLCDRAGDARHGAERLRVTRVSVAARSAAGDVRSLARHAPAPPADPARAQGSLTFAAGLAGPGLRPRRPAAA